MGCGASVPADGKNNAVQIPVNPNESAPETPNETPVPVKAVEDQTADPVAKNDSHEVVEASVVVSPEIEEQRKAEAERKAELMAKFDAPKSNKLPSLDIDPEALLNNDKKKKKTVPSDDINSEKNESSL